MSIASPFESGIPVVGRRIESLYLLAPAIRFAGFWTAVLLPFVLTTMLITDVAVNHPFAVAALLVVNLLGLGVGRNHKQ